MALAITADHRMMAAVVREFLADHHARDGSRALLDGSGERLPAWWKEAASLGWLGLHLPEEQHGQGFGLPELAIAVEEFGYALAPGPFLPTVIASGLLAGATGGDADRLLAELLADLATGATTAAVGVGASLVLDADGTVTGEAGSVLGGVLADVLFLEAGDDVVVVDPVGPAPGDVLDPSRPSAVVTLDGVLPRGVLPGAAQAARRLFRILAAAEAAGIARACLDTAVGYVQQRQQFGRPVGTFQAVKHRCADTLIEAELAAAAVWDACRAPGGKPEAELAAAVAAQRALPAAVRAAETSIQLHGGIGFTWEHDAHLYLRRALTLAAHVDVIGDAARDVLALTLGGARRGPDLDLPPEAETHREQVREFVAAVEGLDAAATRAALVDSGYLVPDWPPPFGRGADATEQLVIEQELAGVEQPTLGITGWVIQTIAQHGTPEQTGRWVRPTLLGELGWCQLFSEPGAGSDAAAVATRGIRVEGGWRVTGQKVWTTRADEAAWGFATVRTDSSGLKHAGITMMAIDMRASGVDVRPLREITGGVEFNEVFLDDVYVPDGDVVGEVGQGWRVARATLGNERVSIGGRGTGSLSLTAADLIPLADGAQARWGSAIGELLAEDHARRLLLLRQAVRAVAGAEHGPDGALAKLVASEHVQRVTGLAVRLAGPAATVGATPLLTHDYLWARCQTIAGGTSEIARNQIAERLLGLPRDPLVR